MPAPVYSESTSPYEFLVRWNDGIITGAHVGFRTNTFKDGAMIADQVEPVKPVAIGIGNGFPLNEILAQLHIDALALCDTLRAERDTAIAELTALQEQISAMNAVAGAGQ